MVGRLIEGIPRRTLLLLLLLLLAAIFAPLFVSDYLITVLILIFYFAYVGQAWNIMLGFAGQLSLGHALYVGLGAYTAAALYVHFGIGPWLSLLVAVPLAAVRSEEHTSELQSHVNLVCRLLLEKKKKKIKDTQ